MNKKKKKVLVQSARKVIRKELHDQLILDVEQTLVKFGQDSKDIKKEIKKSVGKLAKRLAQKLDIQLSKNPEEQEIAIVKNKSDEPAKKVEKVVPAIPNPEVPAKVKVKAAAAEKKV